MKKKQSVYAAIHLDALEQNLENMKKNLTPRNQDDWCDQSQCLRVMEQFLWHILWKEKTTSGDMR